MKKEKYKRDYLPQLRRLSKELEDAIIERNVNDEIEVMNELETIISNIQKSKYAKD